MIPYSAAVLALMLQAGRPAGPQRRSRRDRAHLAITAGLLAALVLMLCSRPPL